MLLLPLLPVFLMMAVAFSGAATCVDCASSTTTISNLRHIGVVRVCGITSCHQYAVAVGRRGSPDQFRVLAFRVEATLNNHPIETMLMQLTGQDKGEQTDTFTGGVMKLPDLPAANFTAVQDGIFVAYVTNEGFIRVCTPDRSFLESTQLSYTCLQVSAPLSGTPSTHKYASLTTNAPMHSAAISEEDNFKFTLCFTERATDTDDMHVYCTFSTRRTVVATGQVSIAYDVPGATVAPVKLLDLTRAAEWLPRISLFSEGGAAVLAYAEALDAATWAVQVAVLFENSTAVGGSTMAAGNVRAVPTPQGQSLSMGDAEFAALTLPDAGRVVLLHSSDGAVRSFVVDTDATDAPSLAVAFNDAIGTGARLTSAAVSPPDAATDHVVLSFVPPAKDVQPAVAKVVTLQVSAVGVMSVASESENMAVELNETVGAADRVVAGWDLAAERSSVLALGSKGAMYGRGGACGAESSDAFFCKQTPQPTPKPTPAPVVAPTSQPTPGASPTSTGMPTRMPTASSSGPSGSPSTSTTAAPVTTIDVAHAITTGGDGGTVSLQGGGNKAVGESDQRVVLMVSIFAGIACCMCLVFVCALQRRRRHSRRGKLVVRPAGRSGRSKDRVPSTRSLSRRGSRRQSTKLVRSSDGSQGGGLRAAMSDTNSPPASPRGAQSAGVSGAAYASIPASPTAPTYSNMGDGDTLEPARLNKGATQYAALPIPGNHPAMQRGPQEASGSYQVLPVDTAAIM